MSFPLPEQPHSVYLSNIPEAHFNQLRRLFDRTGSFAGVIIIVEIDEMRVNQGVADVLVTQGPLHQQDVSGPMIEGACSPVSHGLESNHAYSRIPESLRNITSFHVKPSCEMVELSGSEHTLIPARELIQHCE